MAGIKLRRASELVYPVKSLPAKRTYIVAGTPRGGTSMAAGSLRILNVFLGNDVDPDNNEDFEFLTHKGDVRNFDDPVRRSELITHYKTVIKERNERHDIWGWKDPLSSYYLEDVLEEVTNPFILLVVRDVAAVAFREKAESFGSRSEASGKPSFICNAMSHGLEQYQSIIGLIRSKKIPTLIISYERALRYPESAAASIIDFVGSDEVSDVLMEARSRIAAYIEPDRISGRVDVGKSTDFTPSGGVDFSKYKTLLDAYSDAATAANSRSYDKAIHISSGILSLRASGFRDAPHLAASFQECSDLECGSSFIKAISLANLGESEEAFFSLSEFFSRLEVSKSLGQIGDISADLITPASSLISQIAREIGGGTLSYADILTKRFLAGR